MASYLFWGQEEFNIENRIKTLRKKLINPQFQAMSYKVFNNPAPETLIEVISTQPFMFGNMLILINCEKYFLNTKEKFDFTDRNLKQIEEILGNLSENVHIIFNCQIPRDENKKIDTRRKIYKTIVKSALVEEFPQYRTYDKELVNWIKKQCKNKDITLADNPIKTLIECVGANLRHLDGELEKLKLFKYPKKEISTNDIKSICTQTQDIFKLLDLYIENKKALALAEFKKLNEKQHSLAILSSLQTNLRSTIAIKIDSKKMNTYEIGQKLKLHEYVVKLRLEKLRNIELKDLIKLKQDLTKAELQMKTGELNPPEMALELALLN